MRTKADVNELEGGGYEVILEDLGLTFTVNDRADLLRLQDGLSVVSHLFVLEFDGNHFDDDVRITF